MRWLKVAQLVCEYTVHSMYQSQLRVGPRPRHYAVLPEFVHNTMFPERYQNMCPRPGKSVPAQEQGAAVVRAVVVRAEAVATPGQYTRCSVGRSSIALAAGVVAGRDAGGGGASAGVVHAAHGG